MITRKQIDAAHEVRMWISQVVIPLIGIVVVGGFALKNKLFGGKDA